jgi:hypothetical protein
MMHADVKIPIYVTLNLYVSLRVRDQVSHPYKTG